MPNIQKIVVSGSAISQLTNDVGYALATNITGAFTAVSTSIAVDIAALEAAVGTGGTLISSSAQVNHDATTNFVANEHIDHTSVSITAGSGLSGGGTIAATRTLTLDTSSGHFTGGIKKKLNTDGVISSSAQIATDISGAFTAVSGGLAGRITTNTTNIGTLTGATASYALKTQVSGAFTSTSASIAVDIAALEAAVGAGGTLISSSAEGDNQGQIKLNGVNVNVHELGDTDSPQFANLTLTGDLFVGGTTTTINTANLNIEDKFILLNSGSSGATAEGGIIVEASGSGVGNAFYYDSFENRWSVAEGVNYDDTAVTAEAFMSVAIVDTLANAESSSYYQVGNIIIDGQDIYIVTV
jgi:hypothetical protein